MSPEHILIRLGQLKEAERDCAGVLNIAPVVFCFFWYVVGPDGFHNNNPPSSHLQSLAEIIQKREGKNIKLNLI